MGPPIPKLVLVVDDEEPLRRMLRRTLEQGGFAVLEAEDGPAALAVAAAHPTGIDLLLTDMVMPGMSGPELHRQLLATRPELPAIFMSGTAPAGLSGGSIFLAKPFSPAQLVVMIKALLGVP